MSAGLLCLTCRRYIVTAEDDIAHDPDFHCVCPPETIRPSFDGKVEASESQLAAQADFTTKTRRRR